MENMQMYIVMAITLFMIISFVLNKVPYGVTTMTCCALLVLTGYYDVSQAFSGLANKTTILIAGMFSLAYAFGKTGLINKIRHKMVMLKGKSGLILIVFMYMIAILLAQLMGRTAVISIMILFLTSLDDADEISPSRMILTILSVVAIWSLKVPIGLGATMAVSTNAFYEGLINDSSMLLGTWDFFKVTLFPGIVLTIYAMFAWRWIPNHPIDSNSLKEVKETAALSKKDEIVITGVFLAVMLSFFFGTKIGSLMYVAPAVGVLVLIYAKSMTPKEAINTLTSDMVWMIAGVLVMSDAMGSSGVGQLIGNAIISILGSSSSSFVVLAVFCIASVIMTTFMSNTGTAAILTPIAASTAVVGGMDPRGIILVINIASVMAIAFPSGSAECALMFAAGRHSPVQVLRYTLPYLVLATIALVISANFFFPVYG